eukprot:GHUV01016987.1.p1 GENE.GHUV01016987.1~~GHUV01016987.1.p1  ORF type:complete len:388 (+),score=87.51 GHUV01016987.1:448-1611(+)
MFGLGTLSLPADFARLGWIPALACLIWFAVADVYAGTVYQRLSLKVPAAVVFDEIGYAAMGRLGSAMVYATIYFSILLQPIMLHLTCMESLRQTLYMYNISAELACLIVTVLILPLGQMHHIEDVAWVSIFGTVGMLVAMLVVAGKLVAIYITAPAAAPTEMVAQGQGFHSGLVGAMDIAFAFGGQINWMRYITTMKKRSKFSSAVSITAVFMTVVYLLVAVTGYSAFGAGIDLHKPISSVVGQDAWTVVMNAGIFLHCIIAYQVNVNVWCSLLLHVTMPKYAKELTVTNSWSKKGLWLLVTLLCITVAAFVAYTLPFFSIVMAVIASLGDVLSMFGLPCLFAIYLLPLRTWESGLCKLLVMLATVLSGAGMYASLQQLVEAYHGKT